MPRPFLLLVPFLLASCQPVSPVGSPAPVGPPASADLDYPVPAFALTERSGRPVTTADLAGKVWVASFVFTRCTGPCPAVTTSVAQLQERLKDLPDVRLVTFTIDPARDTLDELRKYADSRRADPERWLFLTGKEDEIHRLATDGFKLLAKRKPGGAPGDEFDHSSRLAVVDKQGVIRGVFDGMAPDRPGGQEQLAESLTKLEATVRRLAK